MKTSISKISAAIACVVALCVALAGCTQGASTSGTESQQANRAYMSQVNETMVQLDESLDKFVDAVSRGDIVNMRTQANNAYKVLDKLSDIEAPDDLKDVRDDYVKGTGKLREALDGYIDLYAEMADKQASADKSTYEARIAEIQSLYDEGVALLKAGDEAVAGTVQSDGSSQAASSESSESSSESASSASS